MVETMITLIISVALVMVSNVQLQNYQQQLVLNNTTRQVKTSIEQAARVSAIRH
ncbi:MAG TPA: Prepilin-type cleavage/methylation protein, partial [Lactobacillus acetotolerans]|nr:Prepilin-type cleavage/methylation protein [Lactobacillus acetotolerans]